MILLSNLAAWRWAAFSPQAAIISGLALSLIALAFVPPGLVQRVDGSDQAVSLPSAFSDRPGVLRRAHLHPLLRSLRRQIPGRSGLQSRGRRSSAVCWNPCRLSLASVLWSILVGLFYLIAILPAPAASFQSEDCRLAILGAGARDAGRDVVLGPTVGDRRSSTIAIALRAQLMRRADR